MSTPQSKIFICSGVPLNNRYEHTIFFGSVTAQQQYFAAKVVRTLAAYSYLRKTWPLKVEATLEETNTWTYLLLSNPYDQNRTEKFYYYFINSVEYVNDHTVELQLELDVMQTYMFDYELLPCFVERQHTPTDEPGEHTVEEGLDVGEYIINGEETLPLSELCIMVMSTYDLEQTNADQTRKFAGGITDGCFTGLNINAVKYSDWAKLALKLNELDGAGKSDGIVSMWMYPKNMIKLSDGADWSEDTTFHLVGTVEPMFTETARPSTVNGYTPKNNKLLGYPYSFMYATNNLGEAATFRYERFGDPTACILRTIGAVGAGGGIRTYALNYNGEQHAYEHGVSLMDWPTCAWNQDVYKLWLAQNQNQHSLSMLTSGIKVVGGLAATLFSGGVGAAAGLGAAATGGMEIANHLAQKADRAIQPPEAKGVTSASINVACTFQSIDVKRKSITREYAEIIDNYFTMYGYKINRVQAPERNARKAFTYVKTIGCHIKSNLCNEDTVKIESVYDSGITFWRDGDRMCDYTQDNSPETEG